MRTIQSTQDREGLLLVLGSIDEDFVPPISVQEDSLEAYADHLLKDGKVIVAKDGPFYEGIVGYFIRDKRLFLDLLWVSEANRDSRLKYHLLKQLVANEPDFEGKIEVKTWHLNLNMKSLLTRLGFELIKTIPHDYVPERTSLVYETDFFMFKTFLSNY